MLAALDAYAASEAALRLELARQYPDLHLGTGYQFDQGQNKWGLGLSLELPVMNRNEGPIAEADRGAQRGGGALHGAPGAGDRGARAGAGGATRRASISWRVSTRSIALQESQLARARSALALGAIDRPAELAAELELRSGELARVDARQALEQSLAALEAALQGPLVAPDALERSAPAGRAGSAVKRRVALGRVPGAARPASGFSTASEAAPDAASEAPAAATGNGVDRRRRARAHRPRDRRARAGAQRGSPRGLRPRARSDAAAWMRSLARAAARAASEPARREVRARARL